MQQLNTLRAAHQLHKQNNQIQRQCRRAPTSLGCVNVISELISAVSNFSVLQFYLAFPYRVMTQGKIDDSWFLLKYNGMTIGLVSSVTKIREQLDNSFIRTKILLVFGPLVQGCQQLQSVALFGGKTLNFSWFVFLTQMKRFLPQKFGQLWTHLSKFAQSAKLDNASELLPASPAPLLFVP